jgi:hypothetical protein
MESVLFVLPRKLRFRSPPRAGDSGACRSDLRHAVASFPRHGASARVYIPVLVDRRRHSPSHRSFTLVHAAARLRP